MGAQGLTIVILDGDYKVAQYGQWDHYPSGQGQKIVEFLTKEYDAKLFREKLSLVKSLTEKQVEAKWKSVGAKGEFVTCEQADKFKEQFPHLSRDCGAVVLPLIQRGIAKEISKDINFAADSLMCEWAYVLDLDNDTLEVFQGFNKKPLGKTQRFLFLTGVAEQGHRDEDNKYFPVRMIKKFHLKTLAKDWKAWMKEREEKEKIEEAKYEAKMAKKKARDEKVATKQSKLDGKCSGGCAGCGCK